MVMESAILLVIFTVIMYIYANRGRVAIQLLLLPMAMLPAANIFIYSISIVYKNNEIISGMYLTIICIASVMTGIFASKIVNKKFRATYITMAVIYFILYTVISRISYLKFLNF